MKSVATGRRRPLYLNVIRSTLASFFVSAVLPLALVSCSSSGGTPSRPDGGGCPTGSEACACFGNKTCNAGLICASDLCVSLGGGTGGATSTGGSSDSGSSAGGTTGTGGSTGTGGTIGTGGSTGTGGTIGTGGSTGTGGTIGTGGSTATGGAIGTGGVPGTGGSSSCSCPSGQQCTTDGHCTSPAVIDDFGDCNMTIDLVAGRTGNWYAAADVGVNLAFAVSEPPSGFSDKACGAWSTGGPTGNGTTTYGIMGATLVAGALPYSLAGYSGLSVNIESGQALGFVVKTSGSGYFQKTIGPTSGAQTYTVPFSSFAVRGDSQVSTLDLTQVTDIQFNALDPSVGYGLAVHALSLY